MGETDVMPSFLSVVVWNIRTCTGKTECARWHENRAEWSASTNSPISGVRVTNGVERGDRLDGAARLAEY